jgi:predicted CopG family antitoxin
MSAETTIRVTFKTRDQLVALGHKNESYNEVILRLIEFYRAKAGQGGS